MTKDRIRQRRCGSCLVWLVAGCGVILAAGCNQDDPESPQVGVVQTPEDRGKASEKIPKATSDRPASIPGAGENGPVVGRQNGEARPGKTETRPEDESGSESGSGAKAPSPGVAGSPAKLAPPAEVHEPTVILSDHHRQTSLVGVGDVFPPLTLTGMDGEPRELSQHYGDRMTIVVFWNVKNLYAREQFERLMQEAERRYEGLGVNVVAINVGDSPEVVRELADRHGVEVDSLLDPAGEAFQQVATGLLPRTYLLDAGGRILWFDLEYSRSQRLGLHNAVYYHLKHAGV